MVKTDTQYIKVTQIKSVIGRLEPQKRTAKALGLRRVNDSTIVPDNDAVRGMVNAISHLVKVEPAEAPKRIKREVALGEIASSPKKQAPRNDAKASVAEIAVKPAPKVAAEKPAVKKVAAKKPAAKAPATAKVTADKPAGKKESK